MKLKILFIIIISAMLFSCTDQSKVADKIEEVGIVETVIYQKVIPDNRIDKAAQFITDTVKAANPMSDEEPEDNIREVIKTAKELFGIPELGMKIYDDNFNYGTFVPYKDLSAKQKRVCDLYLKANRIREGTK